MFKWFTCAIRNSKNKWPVAVDNIVEKVETLKADRSVDRVGPPLGHRGTAKPELAGRQRSNSGSGTSPAKRALRAEPAWH